MRIMIASQDNSFRLALRMFFQTQEEMEIVAEVTRVGELLRDAPSVAPDVIVMDWNLPDIELVSMSGHPNMASGGPKPDQVKAVVLYSLHNIESLPKIIVTDNHQDDLLSALYSGADGFLYQGEMPSKLLDILKSI